MGNSGFKSASVPNFSLTNKTKNNVKFDYNLATVHTNSLSSQKNIYSNEFDIKKINNENYTEVNTKANTDDINKKNGFWDWVYKTYTEPNLAAETQTQELELEMGSITLGTEVAIGAMAAETGADWFTSMKTALLTIGDKIADTHTIQAQSDMQVYGSLFNTQEEIDAVNAHLEEAKQERNEWVSEVNHNALSENEKWKEDHIFNMELSDGMTVREHIVKYSVIKEDSLAWKVGEAAMMMVPVILVDSVAPGAGDFVFALQCYGGALNEAYYNGASEEDAQVYALLTTVVEVGIEKISGGFGGIKNGIIAKNLPLAQLLKHIDNSVVKRVLSTPVGNFIANAIGEGFEEVLSDIAAPAILKLSYCKEDDFKTLWEDQNFSEDFAVGLLTSVLLQGASLHRSLGQEPIIDSKTEEILKNEYDKTAENIKKAIENADQAIINDLSNPEVLNEESIDKALNNYAKNENSISQFLGKEVFKHASENSDFSSMKLVKDILTKMQNSNDSSNVEIAKSFDNLLNNANVSNYFFRETQNLYGTKFSNYDQLVGFSHGTGIETELSASVDITSHELGHLLNTIVNGLQIPDCYNDVMNDLKKNLNENQQAVEDFYETAINYISSIEAKTQEQVNEYIKTHPAELNEFVTEILKNPENIIALMKETNVENYELENQILENYDKGNTEAIIPHIERFYNYKLYDRMFYDNKLYDHEAKIYDMVSGVLDSIYNGQNPYYNTIAGHLRVHSPSYFELVNTRSFDEQFADYFSMRVNSEDYGAAKEILTQLMGTEWFQMMDDVHTDIATNLKKNNFNSNQSINNFSTNSDIVKRNISSIDIETGTTLKENVESVIKYDKENLTAAVQTSSMSTLEGLRRKSIFDIFKRKRTGKIEQTASDYMPSLTDPAKAKEYLLNPDTINEPIYGQQWGKEFVYKYCEGINNNGVLPYNVGKSLVNLLDGQSYVGVHKTYVNSQNLSNIMNEGLNINPAGVMQGIVSNSITIDNNVKEIYHGQVELIEEIRGTSSFRSFETGISADKTILIKHPNGVNPLINVNGQVKVDPKYIVGYVPVENGVVGEIVYNKNYYDYKKESFTFNIDGFELILSKGLNDTLLGEKSGINKNPIVDQGIFDVHNFLIDNNPHYKKTWNAISNNPYVKCNLEITSDRDHYSYNEGIRISPQTFLSQSFSVNFHETGHALLSSNIAHYSQVVNQFNKILNNNAETIKNRATPLFEVATKLHKTADMMAEQVATLKGMDPNSSKTFNYTYQLREGIIRNSGFSAVMDIYDAVTGGKTFDIERRWYGHGEEYYKSSLDKKLQEIFANFHELKCENNSLMNDFCKNLIGNEMWNFLEKTYDNALNAKLTKKEANTTAALLMGRFKNNNAALHSPTDVNSRVNMINTMSYQERFDYIIQNISQKYPNWLNYLNAYINGNGDLTKITRYNDCRLVAKTIPLSEFTRMYNKLNITEILKSFSKDIMTTGGNLPNVVNQFLNRSGNAYHKLININTVQKSYPNKFEYDQFMNKYSEQNGYSIWDQSGYFKHIRYGVQPTSINHRLYINCEPTITYRFLDYFANACKQKGLSFYFKTAYLYNEIGNGHPINANALTRSESAVIYASSSDIIEYINICKQIKIQHPELSFYEPPVATGSIDGWLGYGVEPSGRTAQVAREDGLKMSFNSIRSEMLERGIYDGIKSCIKNNTNLQYFNGQTISHLYVNELYNTIITKYPTMIDVHKQILYKELNNNFTHYMNIICSSDKPYWQFRAQLSEHNNVDILTVDADMIKESLKNFHFNYTINDPGVYRYINFSIKKYARHFYIDENNLYLSE